MVHNTDSRAEFAARLKTALRHAGRGGRGEGAFLKSITGVTAKAASKWLNGETRPGHENLVKIAVRLGVREEWLNYGHGSMTADPHEPYPTAQARDVEEQARSLAGMASPRSRKVLDHIAQAAEDGSLTEEDLLLLEQIANRIAARPAPAENTQNNPHERLKDKLGNNDSSTER